MEMSVDEVPKDFDPDAEIAREVLRAELGDFFSRDDEDRKASTWEAANGRPLKRDWVSWSEWRKYKAKFKPNRPPKKMSLDIGSAQQSLERLRRNDILLDVDIVLMHDLEEFLDLPKTDIEKLYRSEGDAEQGETVTWHRKVSDDQAEVGAVNRFARFSELPTWHERLAAVAKETDLRTLEIIGTRDARPEVRQAAVDRILKLTDRAK